MQSALLHPRVVLFASDSLCNLSALRRALGFFLLIFCAGLHKFKPCKGRTCSYRDRITYLTASVKTFFSSTLQLLKFGYSSCVKMNGICPDYVFCSLCMVSSAIPHGDLWIILVSSFVASQIWLVYQRCMGNTKSFHCYTKVFHMIKYTCMSTFIEG